MSERIDGIGFRPPVLVEQSVVPETRKDLPIVVLSGGDSAERPGSIKSGKTVTELLKLAGYKSVDAIDVTQKNLSILADIRPGSVAFVTMHGGYGEDGTLQGLLEMLDVPYTGSGVAASAISADKVHFSTFIRGLGYSSADQIVVNHSSELEDLDLTYPKVIKPATQGCSYGVFYIRNREELLQHSKFTEKFSDRMIVEEYIPGRELTVGIFEDPDSGKPRVLPIGENILVREIQDFETKTQGGEELYEFVVPAPLDENLQAQIEEACVDVFQQLNCKGYARIDLRVTPQGRIYFLENNTSPGMLSLQESDFPKMLKAGNVDPVEFVDLMVKAALLNYELKHEIQANAPDKLDMQAYFRAMKRD